MDKVMAVIPAAGASRRMGTGVNKQLLSLCGKTVLEHTIRAVVASTYISGIVLVVRPEEENFFKKWSEQFVDTVITVVRGGAERQQSVRNGIDALPADTCLVVIHDGARPLVEPELVDKVVDAAKSDGAATLGVPVKDTVKMTGGNKVVETIPRDNLWLVQTPQVFSYDIIYAAHKWADSRAFFGTDDASLVEAYGYPVTMVKGSYSNIKVTTPEDIIIAEALMKARQRVKES